MAEVVIRTKAITRQKLAQFFPDNHELVRLLESLAQDVTVNIPDAIAPTIIISDDGADLAQTAHSLAIAAQAIAREARGLAQQSSDGPPPAPIVLPDTPYDLVSTVAELRDRLATAERAIAQLKEGPAP